MELAGSIAQHTPVWVFAIFVLLIVTGVQALRPRTVTIWRLVLVPAIFIVWGIFGLVQRAQVAPAFALEWAAAAAIGVAIGWAATRLFGVTFDAVRGIVGLPGSPLPLVRNVAIFVARYSLAVLAAFAATQGERATIDALDVAVSGLATGYFLGWLARVAGFVRDVGKCDADTAGAARVRAKASP